MVGSKKFKVCALVPKADGKGDWFQKIGIAFENRDKSLNAYVESLPLAAIGPKGLKLHIREFTEAEEMAHAGARGSGTGAQPSAPSLANEVIPF